MFVFDFSVGSVLQFQKFHDDLSLNQDSNLIERLEVRNIPDTHTLKRIPPLNLKNIKELVLEFDKNYFDLIKEQESFDFSEWTGLKALEMSDAQNEPSCFICPQVKEFVFYNLKLLSFDEVLKFIEANCQGQGRRDVFFGN